ncbi:MAG: ATP synthase subunit C [Candidatus Bathyarchaeota archaeon]|nr:ATP synthase subunit C [Candidatus Termiticorpusculum sp.]
MNRKILMFVLLPLILLPIVGVASALTANALTVEPVQNITADNEAVTGVAGNYDKIAIAIGAALAIGMPALGAGVALSSIGTAAISALAEKPDTFFKSFLIVALAEALAIYGLIMGILLWLKL